MADTDVASEPGFRVNKRRKVFRRRRDSEGEDDGIIKRAGAETGKGDLQGKTGEVEDADGGVLRMQKRAGVRKHGIGFSSNEGRRATLQQENNEMALVPIAQDAVDEVQNDRFVRPTGREIVTEDKHMMAYVDSKLAEMRSAAASPANAPNNTDINATAPAILDANGDASAAAPGRSNDRTFQLAQARSDRIYQRPTKRPRKKKYERDEADIARDAYIDQFMQETQVPIYDRSTAKGASTEASGDNDAAAAEAFKAQLLADMELNRRRPPKSAAAKAENATSGPKLGGSRQQREKMRAIQEAEGKK